MDVKKIGKIISLLLLFVLLFAACGYSESDLEDARHDGYIEGHSDGYNEGYAHGEEYAIENIGERYPDGRLIFIKNETIDDIIFFADSNGMPYCIDNYIIEVKDYFEDHDYDASKDDKEALDYLVNYAYDAERLIQKIVDGR